MKIIISIFWFLFFSATCFASSESISITLKPTVGLTGTTSFNIHQDGQFTILRYASPTEITEKAIDLAPTIIIEIKTLAHKVFKEVMATEDYAVWPEHKATISVAITKDRVTKSISSRRFSGSSLKLIDLLNNNLPKSENVSIGPK
ncbi:MAG: hypothetical protein ABFS18_00490 [Thermodesulfobacteriota bacterium]